MVDLERLWYFSVIAHSHSLTDASGKLHVSQSALSKSMSQLETSLGIALFDRRKGKIVLNDLGNKYLAYVDEAFARLQAGETMLQREFRINASRVAFASPDNKIAQVILNRASMLWDDILVEQKNCNVEEVHAQLLSDTIDFGLSVYPIRDPVMDCIPVYTDRFLITIHSPHPLYDYQQIPIKELDGQAITGPHLRGDIKKYFAAFCDAKMVSPVVVFESDDQFLAINLMATGKCFSVIPASCVYGQILLHSMMKNRSGTDCKLINFSDPAPTLPLYLTRRNDRKLSAKAEALYDFFKQFLLSFARPLTEFCEDIGNGKNLNEVIEKYENLDSF